MLTDNRGEYSSNSLVILDGNLKKTGAISGIAEDERVYSVRFMGDTAYFVTFRQVDPLFSVDVSDPTSPKIIGSLKIPGFSNYLSRLARVCCSVWGKMQMKKQAEARV